MGRDATQLEATHLRNGDTPVAERIARAIDRPRDDLDAAEREWVERIEAHRRELLADQTEIEVVDYGAGRRGAFQTAAEMAAGTTRTDSIAGVCRRSVSRGRKALVLFNLVREFQPRRALELGSCLGISTAYQASAQALNGGGALIALEGSPSLAEASESTCGSLGLANVEVVVGRFVDTLPRVLDGDPSDYAFVDGHHDEEATTGYFEAIAVRAVPGAVVVFDDIDWSDGMRRAWELIASDSKVATATVFDGCGVVSLAAG